MLQPGRGQVQRTAGTARATQSAPDRGGREHIMASRTLWLTASELRARGGDGDPGAARGWGKGMDRKRFAGSFRRRWAFNDGIMARPGGRPIHVVRRWVDEAHHSAVVRWFLPAPRALGFLRAAACERRRKCRAWMRAHSLRSTSQVTVRWSRSLSRSHPPAAAAAQDLLAIDAPFVSVWLSVHKSVIFFYTTQ